MMRKNWYRVTQACLISGIILNGIALFTETSYDTPLTIIGWIFLGVGVSVILIDKVTSYGKTVETKEKE